jgi:putative transposase
VGAGKVMDTENKAERNRRSLRVPGFDYSGYGPYFVTICTQDRKHLFGHLRGYEISLNAAGKIVLNCWYDLTARFPEVELDSFTVMPNHVHGIIMIVGAGLALPSRGAASSAPTEKPPSCIKRHSLSDVVRAFKSISAIQVNRQLGRSKKPLWQRNYYEHIIRDEESLNRIREYIHYNPLKWSLDRENPERTGEDEFDRWLTNFTARPEKGMASHAPTSATGDKP